MAEGDRRPAAGTVPVQSTDRHRFHAAGPVRPDRQYRLHRRHGRVPDGECVRPGQGGSGDAHQDPRAEWARHGVTVNAVAPGYIATTAVRGLCDKGKLDGAALRRRIPLGELGTPEDIARTVSFLASPQSSYITGITVPVDGGWTAFGAAGDAYPAEVN